ncbi:MAG: PD-(D/E)XK nuclease family transposase [Coprobacillus sp.]
MKNTYNKRIPDICSDYFFHYLMQQSALLRKELCIYLSHDDHIISTTVEYNDTYGTTNKGKKYIMDIVVKDDKDRYYNYEMQNGNISDNDMKRFQIYAMRLVDRQMNERESINHVHKVRQLIIYTGRAIQDFEHYQHKVNLYDKRYQVLLRKGLITMNFIQIQKKEEEEMEVMSRGLQEVMMLFADKDNYKKEQKTELGKEVVELYKKFVTSKDYIPYLQMERDKWVIDYRMQEHWDAGITQGKEEGLEEGLIKGKEEGLEEGLIKGKEEGIEEGLIKGEINGKLKSLNEMIKQKYQVDSMDWLKKCNEEQLDKVIALIFKDLTYDELKEETTK